MGRWPWHRTAFYVEWLQQMVEETERAEKDARQQQRDQAAAESAAALGGLGAFIPAENQRVIGAPNGSEG